MWTMKTITVSGEWNGQTPMPIYAFSRRDGGQPAWKFPNGARIFQLVWESHCKESPRSILSFLMYSPNGWTDGEVIANGFTKTTPERPTSCRVKALNFAPGYFDVPANGYIFVSAIADGGGLEVQHGIVVEKNTVAVPVDALPGF